MKQVLTSIYVAAVLLLVAPVDAQIIINDPPFAVGSGPYVQYNTTNEGGTNTSAINALIATFGANQTYDLTTIDFEDTFTGNYEIFSGAAGPGASIDPLNQATTTLRLPFMSIENGQLAEGTIYDYVRVTNDLAENLGGYFEGALGGSPVQFTTTRAPVGDPEFIFPMMMGSTWSAAYTETTSFGGSTFNTDLTKSYEVDGWGTMVVPTLTDPVPVLRVKSIETRTVGGFEFDTICYDLRANGMVAANFCEGDFDKAPTAFVTILGASGTDTESDTAASELRFDAVYPNPLHERTTFRYTLPEASAVSLVVYDVLGRSVQSLVDVAQPAGTHAVSLEARGLAPGLYVARLQANDVQRSRSFTVVR